MINSLVSAPVSKPEPTFPALFKCGAIVILVTGRNPCNSREYIGTVVSDCAYKVGDHARNWNSDEFKRFDGTVNLKNGD